jgi:hypothetical protein
VGLAELDSGTSAYLDTNVWIYAIEGYPAYAAILKSLLQRIDQKTLFAVTSDLALAEVFVKPMADARADLQEAYETALQSGGNLNMAPITRSILNEIGLAPPASRPVAPDFWTASGASRPPGVRSDAGEWAISVPPFIHTS